MSRYSDFDDLDLDDEDLPLVEIEFDDEEDGKSRKAGTFLKVLLIILIVCALLAAGFFVVRYVLGQQSPKIETTSTVTPEPTMGSPSGSSTGTDGAADTDASKADQTQPGDAASDGDTTETVITTPPTPVLTPTPAPTPKPIPEQYVIPGIDPGDLDAVRAYIQDQLNAMASDVNYPNVDGIHRQRGLHRVHGGLRRSTRARQSAALRKRSMSSAGCTRPMPERRSTISILITEAI